jgi:hypothetical protein
MTIWYFAYGSNMSRTTLVGRRGLSPIETRRARVDGFRLCFDIPVGPGERGVANLAADATARTHGVAHLLTVEDADRLDFTEGVAGGLYRREPVDIVTDGGVVAGFTYRSTMTSPGRKPSARYLDILLDGARFHALPDEYIAVLEAFELAFDERIGAVRR